MIRHLLLALAFSIAPYLAISASSSIKITGKVVDSTSKKGIPFASVTLQDAQNKQIKGVAANDQGSFTIEIEKAFKGTLQVSAIGYQLGKRQISASNQSSTLALGNIEIKAVSSEIKQVVVETQRTLVKVEPDKLVYDPEADPETPTLTTLDMMRKVPLLTVDGDDNIQLKGESNFLILVNGKESPLMSRNFKDVLKGMPASSIKNIEVITTPSSKYSAQGVGGIINIITHRGGLKGVAGNASLRTDNFGSYGGNLYTSAGIDKVAFSINYGYNKYKSPTTITQSNQVNLLSQDFRTSQYYGEGSGARNMNFLSGEFSYEIDSLNLISASLRGFLGDNTNSSKGSSKSFTADNTLHQEYTNNFEITSGFGSVSGNLDYQRSYKKPDKLLTASYNIEYNPNNSNFSNDIEGILSYPSSKNKSKNQSGTYENTFQIDYINPLVKKHLLELGGKYINRNSPSTVDYQTYDFDKQAFEPDPNRNNRLDYTQHIAALYLGWFYKANSLALKGGARVESALTQASYAVIEEVKFRNWLTDVVPYLNLSYNLTPMSSLKLAYTLRLQRPGISHLNPYVNDLDPKNISYGNPELTTEKTNGVELGYNRFSRSVTFDASVYTRFTNNAIQSQVFVRSDGTQERTFANTGKRENYGLSLYGSLRPNANLSFSFNFQTDYANLSGVDRDGIALKKTGWSSNVGGSFNLRFLSTFRFSTYNGYGTGRLDLQSRASSYSYSSFSLRKEFLDRKLTAGISVRNPFKEYQVYENTTFGTNFESSSSTTVLMRRVEFSLSYRFGKMVTAVKKAKRSITNDDIIQTGGSGGDAVTN